MASLPQRLANKRVALSLSSGFFGFYHHAGVLQALTAAGIHPVHVSGTSAGAITGGLFAAGMAPDDIVTALLQISRKDFFDLQFPFARTGFGWLRGERFAAILARLLPVHSFAACPVPFHAGVYGLSDGRARWLSQGSLIDAIRASCAVPYLFAPVEVNGVPYWDGGFAEKTPLGPLVAAADIDAVVISHLPPREQRNDKPRKEGLFSNLAFFADTPAEERIERDRESVRLLRAAGKEVFVLAPPRVWLTPFSLHLAEEAVRQGREGAARILADPSLCGCPELQ